MTAPTGRRTAPAPGNTVDLGLVGVAPKDMPSRARPAAPAATSHAADGELRGVVYLDFTPGGGGKPGTVDRGERGLPALSVEAVDSHGKVASPGGTGSPASSAMRTSVGGIGMPTEPGWDSSPPGGM